MKSRLRLKLQSFILLILIPSLLLTTGVVGTLIYRTLQAVILEGFDRKLSAVSSVTGAFIDGDEHARILRSKNEKSPLYLKYVGPMQRIRKRKGLTFIYTQVLGKGTDIVYVLDGQTGEDHSTVGDQDTLPESEMKGAHGVIEAGKVHLSDIRVWEQWGLLKSGFAPIYDRRGHVTAMAGADVDISTIRGKTTAALAEVGVASLVALLIAVFLAMAIARGLTRSLAEVKEAALQVAAGQYGHRIEVVKPRELADLAGSFNAMSSALAATMQEWSDINQGLEQRRRRQELRRALRGHLTAVDSASGTVSADDRSRILTWLGEPDADPLRATRANAEIALIGKRLLEYYRENASPLLSRLQHLFQDQVTCFVLLDVRTGLLHAIARRPTPATVTDDTGTVRQLDLLITPIFTLAPHARLQLEVSSELLAARVPEGQPNLAQAFMPGNQEPFPPSPGGTTEHSPGLLTVHSRSVIGEMAAAGSATGEEPERAIAASHPLLPTLGQERRA